MNRLKKRVRLPNIVVNAMLLPKPKSDKKASSSLQKAGLHPLFHPNILIDIGEYYGYSFKFANSDMKFEEKVIDPLYFFMIIQFLNYHEKI